MRPWVNRRLQYHRLAWLGPVACWIVVGCSGAHEPGQTPAASPHASLAPTTNVPALLGASIDELHRRLGAGQPWAPRLLDSLMARPLDLATGKIDSLRAFRTGGLTLIASYNAHTRQVRDLLVLGRQEDSLMARASLQANTKNYLLLPVFLMNKPNHLVGLRVIKLDN